MQLDFARLTAEQPSTLYFDRFLSGGIQDAPDEWSTNYPGLRNWHGVRELRTAIKRIANAPPESNVSIASRSQLLMRSAARIMFRVCNKVLTTDCSWPAYQAELSDAAVKSNREVACTSVRSDLLAGKMNRQMLVHQVAQQYEQSGCDGLFLPLVDNFGLRLPVRSIVEAITSIRRPRFVLIDGAQALGHLPSIDCHDICDLFLAGCHKWLRAYLPMGIAIYGRPGTRDFIDHYLAKGNADDPLLRFSNQLETKTADRFSETVNIVPMFTCRAALKDTSSDQTALEQWSTQLSNADKVRQIAKTKGWVTQSPIDSMKSGIVTISPDKRNLRVSPEHRKSTLTKAGISASTYENGAVRFSMPKTSLSIDEHARIHQAIDLCSPTPASVFRMKHYFTERNPRK